MIATSRLWWDIFIYQGILFIISLLRSPTAFLMSSAFCWSPFTLLQAKFLPRFLYQYFTFVFFKRSYLSFQFHVNNEQYL